MNEPFRVESRMAPAMLKTYEISAPKATHFRAATCAEVDCEFMREGWQSVIDEATPIGQAQAHYIRNKSGRRYVEDRNHAPGVTVFRFEAGQTCFNQHEVRLGRPELFIVRGGDYRGNPTGDQRQHANADDWVDDFANHQDQLKQQIEKG